MAFFIGQPVHGVSRPKRNWWQGGFWLTPWTGRPATRGVGHVGPAHAVVRPAYHRQRQIERVEGQLPLALGDDQEPGALLDRVPRARRSAARSSSFCARVTSWRCAFSAWTAYCSKALCTVSSSAESFQGLAMKRKISERLMASSMARWSACPVSMIRWASGTRCFTWARKSAPFIPGSRKSEMTTSGVNCSRIVAGPAPRRARSRISQSPRAEHATERLEDVLLVVHHQQPPLGRRHLERRLHRVSSRGSPCLQPPGHPSGPRNLWGSGPFHPVLHTGPWVTLHPSGVLAVAADPGSQANRPLPGVLGVSCSRFPGARCPARGPPGTPGCGPRAWRGRGSRRPRRSAPRPSGPAPPGGSPRRRWR